MEVAQIRIEKIRFNVVMRKTDLSHMYCKLTQTYKYLLVYLSCFFISLFLESFNF